MRIAFAGTPPFAAVALRRLLDAGCVPPLVLTQPDRPAGRGMKLQASAVKQLALAHGLPVAQPRSLRLDGKFAQDAADAQLALQQARPDVLVVAAYGLILPPWVLALPRLGCVNIHASLLPRWRGAAPVQRAIEAGDAATGVCIMQMDQGLDTGELLRAQPLAIAADDTAASLTQRLADLGAGLLLPALRDLAGGNARRTPQPAEGVSYAHKIDKAEAAIDWRCDAAAIERRARAFDPFPGASFQWRGHSVKLWRAAVRDELHGVPGTLLESPPDTLLMACGRGALQLLELQRPGGRRLPAADWLRSVHGG
ncbi:MAG TPA: methionyl-tRNA formyltransferase [Rubrivivax sp.]|nr:methionyl-tRNA formyltransferase [Rubrivivax sp.]HPO17902.1 methionyl-tRNA formyltransferase [Rubrivivax sp.]